MTISEVMGLKANLVLPGLRLFPGEDDVAKFRELSKREVLRQTVNPAIVLGSPAVSRAEDYALRLEQERMAVNVTDRGSSVEQEYLRESDLGTLAEIFAACVDSSSLSEADLPNAFGYNIEVRCNQDSGLVAKRYLAERLLRAGLAPWGEIEGTSIAFRVRDGEQLWTFTIEPRLQEEDTHFLFAQVNYHFDERRIPTSEEAADSFKRLWSRTVSLLESIDEVG